MKIKPKQGRIERLLEAISEECPSRKWTMSRECVCVSCGFVSPTCLPIRHVKGGPTVLEAVVAKVNS